MKRTTGIPELSHQRPKCAYAAPYICFKDHAKIWNIAQSCCNHWDCPRCGQIRAKEEYARMVEGAKQLTDEKKPLFFWTFTCKGKEVSVKDAESGYLTWTNALLNKARNKANRAGAVWCYVQVTERQRRGHPHSHMLTTYCPDDVWPIKKGEKTPLGYIAKHDGLWSDWYVDAARDAGLGEQVDISAVRTPEAVARYIGKYLFKQTARDTWPKGWKRVRYSQNWPKLPEINNPDAFPVINRSDWFRVAALEVNVRADTVATSVIAAHHGAFNVIPPKW